MPAAPLAHGSRHADLLRCSPLPVKLMTLDEIIEVLRQKHRCGEPCKDTQLEVARRDGLPEELIAFYARANGATLYCSRPRPDPYTGEPSEIRFEFIVPPIDENDTIDQVGFIDSSAPLYEASKRWRVVCDLADGDLLSIETVGEHRGRVIECDHEQTGWPDSHIVFAQTFTEALERLLTEEPFSWRAENPPRYGTLEEA